MELLSADFEKAAEEMKRGIGMDIKPVRTLLILVYAACYPLLCRVFTFSSQYLDLLYYIILAVLCILNHKGMREFLKLPSGKGKLPGFAGPGIDVFFTYPVLLAALISTVNSLLVLAGAIPHDAQGLSTIDLSLAGLIGRSIFLPVVAFAEELFNLLLMVFIYNTIKARTNAGLAASILVAAAAFGLLHAFSWNLGAAAAIGISFIPVFAMTLYLKSIRVSVLAHFYNDLITVTGMYSLFYSKLVIAVLLLPCVFGLVRELIKGSVRHK